MAYTKDTADRLKDIKQKVGMRDRLEQLAEEAYELSQAALKYIRATEKTDNPTLVSPQDAYKSLLEEAADVTVSLRSIDIHSFSTEDKEEEKIKRWHDRLKEVDARNKSVEAKDDVQFEVGDRVRFVRSTPDHDRYIGKYYPPLGTVGTVISVTDCLVDVQWPDRTTEDDGMWCVVQYCLDKVKPLNVQEGGCVRLIDVSALRNKAMDRVHVGSIGVVRKIYPNQQGELLALIEWILDEVGDEYRRPREHFVVRLDLLDQFCEDAGFIYEEY